MVQCSVVVCAAGPTQSQVIIISTSTLNLFARLRHHTPLAAAAHTLPHAAPPPLLQVPALRALVGEAAATQLLPVAPLPPPSSTAAQRSHSAVGAHENERYGATGHSQSELSQQQQQQQEEGVQAEREHAHVPGSFHGQWCRCTLYLEGVSLPPNAAAGVAGGRVRTGKAYKYYVTYVLPGWC